MNPGCTQDVGSREPAHREIWLNRANLDDSKEASGVADPEARYDAPPGRERS